MSDINATLPADEQRRLDECVLESIRTPGTVQPHGVLLAFDPITFDVVHVSENCGRVVGIEAGALLGRSVAELTGLEPLHALREFFADGTAAANPVPVLIQGEAFDAIVHRSGELGIVEFEPVVPLGDHQSAPALYGAIHRLAKSTTIDDLWAGAARELRRLTGFDRVMIYHFHPDGHGEIVAEDLAESMESYLGLHFPASDIPVQARHLYLTKLSRVIVASDDENPALLAAHDPRVEAQLELSRVDLGQAELRSVSPHHLQFMRNMGQASTMSLSLIHEGELIGMITCAHRTGLRIPFTLRQGLEVLANQVALQLRSMTEIARLTRRFEIRGVRSRLVSQLSETEDMAEALLRGALTLVDLVPADGAALRLEGKTASIGDAPSAVQLAALVERVRESEGGLTLVTDSLAVEHPDLAALVPAFAGLLLVPLGGDGDYIAWFRHEITRTINWLGDLSPANRATPLSPRNSFSSWTESVTGTAVPWAGLEFEAVELCRDVDGASLRRAESKLASLALHDPLTGLPNRRLLLNRLEHALTRYARGEEVALLFIDLDGFKIINDSSGHDVGDALIVHAARQILAATRAQDTVARLGGDEFVVLCENTTAEEADVIAERIVVAIRRPAGGGARITASIGITTANLSFSASELLREADAAMYRAKAKGRNRASR